MTVTSSPMAESRITGGRGGRPPTGPLAGVDVQAILGDDEDVKLRIKALVIMALDESIRQMRYGSEMQRSAMTRMLLPAVTKMLAAKEDGGADDLRDKIKAMTAAAMGTTDGI